jgi:hypothetical protein
MTKMPKAASPLYPKEAIRWLTEEFADLDTDEAIRWLAQAAGQDRWLKRADELLDLASGSEAELRTVLERHHIEVCIAAAIRHPRSQALAMQPFLDAFVFAAFARHIHDRLSAEGKKRHVGKLKQALKEEYGFAALRTEHTAMMMGFGIGCTVAPMDLEGIADYDLLLSANGEEVELECKLLTHDFGGSQVRIADFQRLRREMEAIAGELLRPGTSKIAWLTLRDRLPRKDQEAKLFATAIGDVVLGKCQAIPSFAKDLKVEDWPRGISEPGLAHAEARFLTVFQQCYTFAFAGERSAFILAINSMPDVKKYGALVERRFKDAADQLSGSRPGVIFAEMEGPNFDTGMLVQIVPRYFTGLLQEVFRTRPFLELVILGFPGPPFSSGASVPIRNPRRKRRNSPVICQKLERNAQPRKSSAIPFRDFRKGWWQQKYRWDHKGPKDVQEALRCFRSGALKPDP